LETDISLEHGTSAHCAECGSVFPVDDMIRHGNAYVCARCKPVFMQKLLEGAEIRTGKLRYAGFWLRFGAILLDGIALGIVSLVVGAILGASVRLIAAVEPMGIIATLLVQFLSIILAVSYETFFIGRYGATLGKMACHIHVVAPDGGRVSYLRAFARYFAKLLSSITLLIGFIMAAFDAEGRALHDRICNTRVVLE
jgi:uncharacterized RDD family membrane protein YckC